jgi:hypothetical protein
MSYVLDAFIGPFAILKEQMHQLPTTKFILLEQGIAMAPMGYETRRALNLPDTIKPFWHLPDKLFQLGINLSAIGPLGYLEIEFFGGTGEQAAVLWDQQEVTFGPYLSEHNFNQDQSPAINQLLQHLGVQRGNSIDEFAAIGLTRYRSNEDWLASV